jgi:predicted ATPase/DNA-binding CsgD family transcriptional regulator
VELLERDEALAALVDAREAVRGGGGRVVLVTGEPGIGKTSLVTRFVRDLAPGARVLAGTCDDLSIPRPLGPIRDLGGSVSQALEAAVSAGAPSHEIQGLLLAELSLPPRPTVLVLEDVHWADDATLDSVTVLARRIGSLPALLVLTFRGGETPPGHPLRAVLGAIPPGHSVYLELAPLSESAVVSLAGEDGRGVYALTGGNPFFVAELLAADNAELPPSVANAVLGRIAALDGAARSLLELVSVVPGRTEASVLDAVMPSWPAAAEEPERRQLLEVGAGYVRFRHELARHALRSSLPKVTRRRLHAEVLGAVLAADADPADIVHHAEGAGAKDVLAEYALLAARRAAALDSNRQAYSHYRRAADFVGRLPPPERAKVLEELAAAAYAVGRLDDAFPAIERAIAGYEQLGDEEAVGRCRRVLARFHWYAGDGAAARRAALEAVAILERLGESAELARAYSGLSQLEMLAEDAEQALAWSGKALELANRLGDESTRVHALVNIGTAAVQLDPRESAKLLEAHAIADAAGDPHEATRALLNMGYTLMCWVQPALARRFIDDGIAYAREHEVYTLASYAETVRAWLRLRAGEWDEAERITRAEVEKGISVPQLLAKTVLAELAVRRGDPDASQRLADLAAQAERTGELQRIAPALELEAEWALLSGAPMPAERLESLLEEIELRNKLFGWSAMRAAAWAHVAGVDVDFGQPMSAPHAAMYSRDWRRAASAFDDVGWTYDRALMLSLLDDEEALVEAIEIARRLGADPLTARVARRLRALGLSVPRGPRGSTRANPAGLTARQLEVLSLLAGGLTNAEIADRLVVSPRTAEHHVAAVLTKLGATTRHDAARRASELGLA